MKSVQWIISEAGMQSLMNAGLTVGWLKAWLMSAGATVVKIYWLESDDWKDANADWHIFFATDDELANLNKQKNGHTLLLPIGDIARQRHDWLLLLNDAKPLMPLYVRADDSLPIALEPGLSASLSKPMDGQYLNTQGWLIEEQVIAVLKQQKLSIRNVEACTAGAIAARLCRVAGASEVVDRAWVTYSNAAKQEEVGVAAGLFEQYGAVSQEVIVAMAEGGCGCGDTSHICIAVAGIAGPDGGSKDKPVGTVWIAVAMQGSGTVSRCLHLTGARHEIQARTSIESLHLLLNVVEKSRF